MENEGGERIIDPYVHGVCKHFVHSQFHMVQFANKQEDGAKLIVPSALNTDAGNYLCQLNTEPPKKLYHSLEILGESDSFLTTVVRKDFILIVQLALDVFHRHVLHWFPVAKRWPFVSGGFKSVFPTSKLGSWTHRQS